MHALAHMKMDRVISEYCKKSRFFGSLRITKDGRMIYQRLIGQADHESHTPITEKSVYTLYSLSNPFVQWGC